MLSGVANQLARLWEKLTRPALAYRFYGAVGLVMLILWALDLRSGGEVALQLPLIVFMGFPLSFPLLIVFFVLPTAGATVAAHRRPLDPLLLAWTYVHLLFWLFLLDQLLFFFPPLVTSMSRIQVVWGTYALMGSVLPLGGRSPKGRRAGAVVIVVFLGLILLALLISGG